MKMENYVYFDWECTVCGKCICRVTSKGDPLNHLSSKGVQLNACRDGFQAKYVPVKGHERDMNKLAKTFA